MARQISSLQSITNSATLQTQSIDRGRLWMQVVRSPGADKVSRQGDVMKKKFNKPSLFRYRTLLGPLLAGTGLAFVVLCALTFQGTRQAFPTVVVHASDDSCTALIVDNDKVKICRDSYGVPHIFAETNKALFQGFGYADAQDRLWQLELFRRAAKGQLSEILGASGVVTNVGSGSPSALTIDLDNRTRFYNEEQLGELSEQFAILTSEEREMFTAYADGINRYLAEVVMSDPAHKLPFELQYLGIGVPASWTPLDVVANSIYQSRFGQVGGTERQNQALLNNLISKYCQDPGKVCEAAWGIFNDIRWKNDPDAPVSVPSDEAVAKQEKLPHYLSANNSHPDRRTSARRWRNRRMLHSQPLVYRSRTAVTRGLLHRQRARMGRPCYSVHHKFRSILRNFFMKYNSREATVSMSSVRHSPASRLSMTDEPITSRGP
jgi:hypothetical protein